MLSFVGEHYQTCEADNFEEVFKESGHVLTVLFCGEISPQILIFIKQNPSCPFLTFDLTDAGSVKNLTNVMLATSPPLTTIVNC